VAGISPVGERPRPFSLLLSYGERAARLGAEVVRCFQRSRSIPSRLTYVQRGSDANIAAGPKRPRPVTGDGDALLANGVIDNEHDKRLLILFTESLDIGLAVRIEKFLAALLPRRFEFGGCDVPVRPAFLGNGT
jgi:hypothetical protein